MTTISHSIQPTAIWFPYFRPLLAFLRDQLEARRTRTEARRTIRVLMALDDNTLRDIGVTRRELVTAKRKSCEGKRAGVPAPAGVRLRPLGKILSRAVRVTHSKFDQELFDLIRLR